MKIILKLVCLTSLSLIISCNAQKKGNDRNTNPPISQLEWLQGNWKGTYNNAPFYEAWRKATDSVIVNFTIEIKGRDTVVKENGAIRLTKQSKGFVSMNASWELESLSDDRIVLRNDTLKYANRIIWSHSKNDHWLTEIHNPTGVIHYDLERVSWLDGVVDRFIKNAGRK